MTKRFHARLFFALVGSTTLLSPPVAHAQVTTTGEIHGTVVDPTGAVVPTAAIKLEDEATGIAKETTSVKDGGFVFVTLPAGSYRLSATAKGFRTAVYTGVVVETARTRDIVVQMTIGEASTTVEVNSTTTPIETSSNELSTTVQNRLVAPERTGPAGFRIANGRSTARSQRQEQYL